MVSLVSFFVSQPRATKVGSHRRTDFVWTHTRGTEHKSDLQFAHTTRGQRSHQKNTHRTTVSVSGSFGGSHCGSMWPRSIVSRERSSVLGHNDGFFSEFSEPPTNYMFSPYRNIAGGTIYVVRSPRDRFVRSDPELRLFWLSRTKVLTFSNPNIRAETLDNR